MTSSSAFHPDPSRPVVIIGAGPAGLMAAERLSAAGLAVEVHERMPSPTRKFLMAGRGGLNLTHSEPLDRFAPRYGARAPDVMGWLSRFGPQALRDWADGLGAETFVGSSGRVFPRAMKASPLLRAWLQRLRDQGVSLHAGSHWIGFEDGAPVFDQVGERRRIPARAVVVATGGASWPRLGSDGQGREVLAALGVPGPMFRPANVGARLDWSADFIEAHAGQPLKAVALTLERRRVRGEAMVTRYGLEGGAVYALGPELHRALARAGDGDGPARLYIDLRPSETADVLAARLSKTPSSQSRANRLRRAARLRPVEAALLRQAPPLPAGADDRMLAERLKGVPLTITGLQGLERAISSAGGIDLAALTPGLMVPDQPGLFVAGEILDWEAPTGGYLLQAVMASGVVAADGVADWIAGTGTAREAE
ncbi:NAD(P)/FAD-dependent oxidoreductase [Brevundimonas sp.]|uniref:NAD(P)/FAD-dependent oxidoreductase n=1 Tax=Brevundimonas sp. TaxID=1871086 RepID=UPI003AF86BC5